MFRYIIKRIRRIIEHRRMVRRVRVVCRGEVK